MKQKCSAHRTDGEPCTLYPVHGSTVCHKHGAAKGTPARRKAEERALEAEMRTELARLDVPPVTNALQEMQELAGQVKAWKNALAEKVNVLGSLRYSTDGGEQLRAEVALWERALDRCTAILAVIARHQIDQRLVAIEESKAKAVVDAVDAWCRERGMNKTETAEAKRAIGRHLRSVG